MFKTNVLIEFFTKKIDIKIVQEKKATSRILKYIEELRMDCMHKQFTLILLLLISFTKDVILFLL